MTAGNYIKYDNGPKGWTEYNSSGQMVSAGTSPRTDISTSSTPTTTTVNTVSPYSDIAGYANSLAAAQLAAKQAAINKAKDEAISNHNQQIDATPQQYQPLRNQAELKGAQNEQAIKEQMAAGGNWRSGENVSAQAANNASTANAVAGYNLQQQDVVNKLKQAIEQVRTNAGYDSAQAVNDTEAQRLQTIINQANTDRTFNQQVSQDNFNNGLNAAQVTGYIPNSISSLYPAYNVPSQTYGLAADVAANPGINLYIPGQTQLKAGDIFLGGTGTGVTDSQLNGATRIAGNTANDTASLYKTYLNNVASGRIPTSQTYLPPFIAQQFPGATEIVNTGNGMYRFRDASGNLVYYEAS